MALPLHIIVIRHGLSEGNVANHKAKQGDRSTFDDPEFRDRHFSSWRLVEEGRQQVAAAREWLHHECGDLVIQRGYVSPYIRAMETALYLELDIPWIQTPHLRERLWGDLASLADNTLDQLYRVSMQELRTQPLLWTPPGAGGESMATYCSVVVDRMLDTLSRSCEQFAVVLVSHGGWLRGLRVRLERLTHEEFLRMSTSDDPYDRIHNCQILHYSRCNPTTGEAGQTIRWFRSVCPWDLSRSSNEWTEIERHEYRIADLRRIVESVPQLVI